MDPYSKNNVSYLTASERRRVWFPKLSLPVIATYTPEPRHVDLADQAVEDEPFAPYCHLVGKMLLVTGAIWYKKPTRLGTSYEAGY